MLDNNQVSAVNFDSPRRRLMWFDNQRTDSESPWILCNHCWAMDIFRCCCCCSCQDVQDDFPQLSPYQEKITNGSIVFLLNMDWWSSSYFAFFSKDLEWQEKNCCVCLSGRSPMHQAAFSTQPYRIKSWRWTNKPFRSFQDHKTPIADESQLVALARPWYDTSGMNRSRILGLKDGIYASCHEARNSLVSFIPQAKLLISEAARSLCFLLLPSFLSSTNSSFYFSFPGLVPLLILSSPLSYNYN